MVPEVIEQMRKELYDTRFCVSDFEKYDLKALENTNEPFFWMVREHGTTLSYIGPTRMSQLFDSEEYRIALMKDELAPITDINYWNDNSSKYFYWSGYNLTSIQKEDMNVIFQQIWSDNIKKLKDKYPEEYAVINKPLNLAMNPQIEKLVEEVLGIAENMNDDSLSKCLNRLSNWTRKAVNHKIEIYRDFAKYSFGFCEMINGKSGINGGIIFNPNATNKHWSIHT